MNIPDREELEQELEQLRINRAIEKSSWFAHKSYAEELIQTLGASGNSLLRDADKILKEHLKPTADKIRKIEEMLHIDPEKRVNIEIISSMGL